jgi:hypothetical protein
VLRGGREGHLVGDDGTASGGWYLERSSADAGNDYPGGFRSMSKIVPTPLKQRTRAGLAPWFCERRAGAHRRDRTREAKIRKR